MVSDGIVIVRENGERKLTASAYQSLADVPPEVEWFENIENKNTRRAYRNDIREFMAYAGIRHPGEIRTVKRAHVIAWRKQLEIQALEAPTIRRKLSALSSLFVLLCESNAIEFNPVDGVKRPTAAANEGRSPALSDDRAKALLNAPSKDTVKGLRDRAILSALLFHGLRRAELCSLKVGDLQERGGVVHFRVEGKGGKMRFIPVHPHTITRVREYLARLEHGEKPRAALFWPVKNPRWGVLEKPLTGDAIYKNIVQKYARELGIEPRAICVHGLRATAATNALDHSADIAKVQEWLGHASISTTRLYDRRKTRPEDSPTFKVSY